MKDIFRSYNVICSVSRCFHDDDDDNNDDDNSNDNDVNNDEDVDDDDDVNGANNTDCEIVLTEDPLITLLDSQCDIKITIIVFFFSYRQRAVDLPPTFQFIRS